METYFDNSATTRVSDSVKNIVVKTMTGDYGNTAAKHSKGMVTENHIEQARAEIAKTLKVQDKEILFTSGGTEPNNMALMGTAFDNERAGKHIISSNIEHASVYNPLGMLADHGYEIMYLLVDEKGYISLKELEEAIRPDTLLVSIMRVNNEIRTIELVEEVPKVIKRKNPKTIFHVGAIQTYGKYTTYPKRQGIDLLGVSDHKIHGPKGVGFLYIDEKVKVKPLTLGGDQQKGMHSGTENAPGVAGLGVAVKEMYTNHEEKPDYPYGLKDCMIGRMVEVEGTHINSEWGRLSAPQATSASFDGIRSEVLLYALEEKGIYVSSGLTCSSDHPGVNDTLKTIGMKKELLDTTPWFNFELFNTKEEIDYSIEVLKELLPVLRRYRRG